MDLIWVESSKLGSCCPLLELPVDSTRMKRSAMKPACLELRRDLGWRGKSGSLTNEADTQRVGLEPRKSKAQCMVPSLEGKKNVAGI